MGLPAEVLDQLPPEIRPSLEKFNDVPTALKSYVELEKYRGNSIALPGEKDAPEAIEKWKADYLPKLQTVLGDRLPPAKPEDYEFKFEGVEDEAIKSDKVLGLFRQNAHKLGLSKAQASGLADVFAKEILPALIPKQDMPEFMEKPEDIKALMTEVFKGDATQRVDEYRKGVQILKQSVPELEDLLNEGVAQYGQKFMSLGDHPGMVKLITEIGKLTGADFAGPNTATTQQATDAKSEIDDIMYNKDNPRHERFKKGDPQVMQYMQELWKATTGGK